MMPFRHDLDLSGIVDKFEAFGGKPTAPPIYQSLGGTGAPIDYTPAPMAGEGPDPAPVGAGPLRCSTSRAVVLRRPLWAWDPNYYYRNLGVPWPYVHYSRGDLRRAYQESNGQDSERLTYCLKQLINVREEYDALPLGEVWMDDIYIQAELRRRVHAEAAKRSARGDYTTFEEMLDKMGLFVVPDDTPGEDSLRILDDTTEKWFDDHAQHESVGPGWDYAFYLWKTTAWDSSRLQAWQEALIAQVDPTQVPHLVVGLVGKVPHEYVIGQVADDWVVFLNHKAEVSPDLAARAITALTRTIHAEQHASDNESRN